MKCPCNYKRSVENFPAGGFNNAGMDGVGVSGAFFPLLAAWSIPADCGGVGRSSLGIVSVGRGADSDPGLDFCSRMSSSNI